jgi:uncharacterized protein (TIGR03435 family)
LTIVAVAISAGAACFINAQEQGPRFDAVSLRRVDSTGSGHGPTTVHIDSGRLQVHHYSLTALVTMAYKVTYFQIAWPKKDHEASYDVDAVMPQDITDDQRNLMMQNMMRERLGFRAHQELRPVTSFVLLVSPKGLKIKQASGPSDPSDHSLGRLWVSSEGYSVKGNITMGQLTEMFSPNLEAPFLDRTGLQGYYTLELSIPRETNIPEATAVPDDITPGMLRGLSGWSNGRFISTLEKETGLRVESRAADTDVMVVDSFHLDPTEN